MRQTALPREPATASRPITDVSLLALPGSHDLAALRGAVRAAAPDLCGALEQAAGSAPGLHVTLYEFLTVPGHAALPGALDWCRQAGDRLLARAARLGPVTFGATSLARSSDGVAVMLVPTAPAGWLQRLRAACSATGGPPPGPPPGVPARLHLTIGRGPGAGPPARPREHPLDLTLRLDRLCLALATRRPYGQLRWQRTITSGDHLYHL